MTVQPSGEHRLYGQPVSNSQRRRWFGEGAIPVAVYGLGKMGLPLAAVYAETTGNVLGVDIDEHVVEQLRNGECPVQFEPGLPDLLSSMVESGALRATTDPQAGAEQAALHVVIVPTTVTADNRPDLSALQAVTRDIGAGLDSGDMVIVESTVPPGTCWESLSPILAKESGLSTDEFGLAFCPERTSSGRALQDIRGAYPKVVGGTDRESGTVAELVYDELTSNEIVRVENATTAECVKLFEGVYRDVNIALANELAGLTTELHVDVLDAIEAANTQPYCDIHDPGAGVGGHCIPYYPHFLSNTFQSDFRLLGTAREINEEMPAFAVARLLYGFEDAGVDPQDATIAVLGIAYRPGIPETSDSPAFPIIEELTARGTTVIAADPVVDGSEVSAARMADTDRLHDFDLDGAILVTAHEEFDRIDWAAFDDLVIVDGRDALAFEQTDHAVYTIGRGRQ